MQKKIKPKSKRKSASSECNIPPPIPGSALHILVFPYDSEDVRKISEYVEWQAKGETVAYTERISEEYVRAPRKIALFGCAHWMRERHAGFVARDRNGSAWLFRP